MRSPRLLLCALFLLGNAPGARAGEDEGARRVRAAEHFVESARGACTRFERELVRAAEGLRPALERCLAAARERLALSEAALAAARAGEAGRFAELAGQIHTRTRRENVLNQWVGLERRALRHRKAKPEATEREAACRARLLVLYAETRAIYTRFAGGEGGAPRDVWRETVPKEQHAERLERALQFFDDRRRLLARKDKEPDDALRARFDERLRLQDALIEAMLKLTEARAYADKVASRGAVEALHREARRWEEDYRARREIAELERKTADAPPGAGALAKEIAGCLLEAARLSAEADARERNDAEAVLLEGRAEGLEAKAELLERALDVRLEAAEIAKDAGDARADALVGGMLLVLAQEAGAYEKRVRKVAQLAADAVETAARAEAGERRLDDIEDRMMDADDLLEGFAEAAADAREEAAGLAKDAEAAADLVEECAEALGDFDEEFAGLAAGEPKLARDARALLERARSEAEKGLGLVRAGHADKAKGALAAALRTEMLAEFLLEGVGERMRVERDAARRELDPEAEKLLAAYREDSGKALRAYAAVVRSAGPDARAEEVAALLKKAMSAFAEADERRSDLNRVIAKAPLKEAPPPPPVRPAHPARPVPGPFVPAEPEEEDVF